MILVFENEFAVIKRLIYRKICGDYLDFALNNRYNRRI